MVVMRGSTFGLALAAAAVCVFACSSFTGTEEAQPTTDGGADVEASAPSTCASPVLVDDPAAKPDDHCGANGAVVDVSTDLEHCGACKHACALPGTCVEGNCSPSRLWPGAAVVSAFVAGDTVYAVDTGRQIMRGKISASTGVPFPGALLAANTVVRRMQLDESWLYLSTTTGPQRLKLDAPVRDDLDPNVTDGLMAVGSTVFFYATSAGVSKRAKADGAVLLNAPSPGTKDVVADGDTAYWVATKGDTTSLHGPFPSTDVIASGPSIEAVTLDAEYIYYADTASRQIRRVPRRGGSSQPVASELTKAIGTLAVSGDYVYWTADRGSVEGWSLMRVAKCGGVPLVLAKVQPQLTQLSFDASRVFVATVTSSSQAELVAIAK